MPSDKKQEVNNELLPLLSKWGNTFYDMKNGSSALLSPPCISYNEDLDRFEMIWRYSGKLKATMVNDAGLRDPSGFWSERADDLANEWLSAVISTENAQNQSEKHVSDRDKHRTLMAVRVKNRRTLAWVRREERHPEINFSLKRIAHANDARAVAQRYAQGVIDGEDPTGQHAETVIGHWVIEGFELAVDNQRFIGEWRSAMAQALPFDTARISHLLRYWPPHMQPLAQATGAFVQRTIELNQIHVAQKILNDLATWSQDYCQDRGSFKLSLGCLPYPAKRQFSERVDELLTWEVVNSPSRVQPGSARGIVSRPFLMDELAGYNPGGLHHGEKIVGEIAGNMKDYVDSVLFATQTPPAAPAVLPVDRIPPLSQAERNIMSNMAHTLASGSIVSKKPTGTRPVHEVGPEPSGVHPPANSWAQEYRRLVYGAEQEPEHGFQAVYHGEWADNTEKTSPLEDMLRMQQRMQQLQQPLVVTFTDRMIFSHEEDDKNEKP